MLTRPLLALYTTLCLLVNLLVIPSGPVLVCRMTGEPMAPVVAKTAEEHSSCCAVSASIASDGTTHYALTAPGCCDLRQSVERTNLTAVSPTALEFPIALLVTAPSAIPLPQLTKVIVQVEVPRESAPRAPPLLSSASPRAPPFFS